VQHFDMIVIVVVLLGLIFAGVHVAVALGVTAVLGVYLLVGDFEVIRAFVANTAYESLRDYVFAVLPLFLLMGDFLAKSGAARDLYALANRVSRWLPARLAVATIVANALFSFVTGVSIAAAAAFSRIAYPEMHRYGYGQRFALGSIAGSSCLGMLIPPSVLLIVWAVLTELSIGQLFLAGVLPGLMIAGAMIAYVVIAAIINPALAGAGAPLAHAGAPLNAAMSPGASPTMENEPSLLQLMGSAGMVVLLVLGVLMSIWFGFATPTEGAAVGAVGAMFLAILRGITLRELWQVVLDVGRTLGPLLLLLVCAQLYSRVLSMTGFTEVARQFLLDTGLGPWGILLIMVLIWFLLGMLIDSISIILLTVPIFAPIAVALGFDPLAFAIMGIVAIECGLLTPPFGLLVFTVKAALPDRTIPLAAIFYGSIPYWLILLGSIVMLAAFPQISTFLPNL
jgi:C4-dicarboxylate transporter, DctM subunit